MRRWPGGWLHPWRPGSPEPGRIRPQAHRRLRPVLPAVGPPGSAQDSRQMRVSRVGDAMAKVVVRFFDDETLEGIARDLDFDEPDFLVEVDDAGGLENNETAWIPLTAVKWVELPRDPNLASETPTRKVAIPFLDGEVLPGPLHRTPELHPYAPFLPPPADHAPTPLPTLR